MSENFNEGLEEYLNEEDFDGIIETEIFERFGRDVAQAAMLLSPREARYYVDDYYIAQNARLRTENQIRAQKALGEPYAVASYLLGQKKNYELYLKGLLDWYSKGQPIGIWARSNMGVGPVTSAGLMAHIDITKAPTAGHIWRFAGLDPTVGWIGAAKADALVADMFLLEKNREKWKNRKLQDGDIERIAYVINRKPERVYNLLNTMGKDRTPLPYTFGSLANIMALRPWNARLKVICYHIGNGFMKTHNKDDSFYGKIYEQRKALEIQKNENRDFAEQAERELTNKKYSHNTSTYKTLKDGRLSDAHIDARARRYAVKMFLSHYHEMAYRDHYKTDPPAPYIMTKAEHSHYIAPPNQDLI